MQECNGDDGRFATILSSFLHLSLALGLIENNSSGTTENSPDTDIKPVVHKFSFLHLLYFIEVKKFIHSRNIYSQYTIFKIVYRLL